MIYSIATRMHIGGRRQLKGTGKLAMVLTAFGLSACANSPLYNEGRDKQAQELAQSVKGVNLLSLVSEQEQRFSKLQQFEAGTAREVSDMRLQREMISAAGKQDLRNGYASRIEARLAALIGGPTLTPEQIRALRSGAVAPGDGDSRLAVIAGKASDARLAYDASEHDVTSTRQALHAAQAEYDKEVAQLKPRPGDEGYRAKVAAAATKLAAAIKKTEDQAAKNQQLEAYVEASTMENLEALERVSDAVAAGKSDPAELSVGERRAAAVLISLPTVVDEVDKLLKEAKRPRLAPLLLSIDQQRLALKSFEERRALQLKKVKLLEEARDACIAEVRALARARSWLADGRPDAVPLNLTFAQLIGARNSRALTSLYRSFGEYFDNAQRWRRISEEKEAAAGFTTYEVQMLKSKYAAMQWQTLLDGTSAILADYHATGVKPQELSDFAKAVGLIFIGSQVGK